MMNTCRQIRLELAAYDSDELDAAGTAAVERHLDGCRACRTELRYEREIRASLGALPTAACPPGVGDFVPSAPPRRVARKRVWSWSLAAAAALVAAVLGGLATRAPSPQPNWTDAELAAARQEMIFTLSLTADAIDRGRRAAVVEVFGERLPRAVTGSLKLKSPEQGDEG